MKVLFRRARARVAFVALCVCAPLYADLTTGLVAHWKFDEETGTSASDSSGQGNAGTLSGGATWSTDRKVGSRALQLNGSNGQVGVTATSGLPAYNPTGPYSVSLWFKNVGHNHEQTLYAEMEGAGNRFIIQTRGNVWVWLPLGASTSLLTSNAGGLTNNTWNHLVWTDHGGTAKLYINGVEDTANFNYTPGTGKTAQVILGSSGWGFWEGLLDDVRVYNRVLSPAEVTALYSGQTAPTFESHPSPKTVSAGSEATFTVSASNNPNYQWQRRVVNGEWSDVNNDAIYSGATTATLTIISATPAMNGYQFRCRATNAVATADSNGVALTVTTSGSQLAKLSADFSGTQGGNGWMYGYLTRPGDATSFATTGMTYVVSEGFWRGNETYNTPLIGAGTGHPGYDSHNGVHYSGAAKWSAGVTATATISVNAQMISSGSVSVIVYKNTQNLGSLVLSGNGSSDAKIFTGVSLVAGDIVTLELSADGSPHYDSANFDLTVTAEGGTGGGAAPTISGQPTSAIETIAGESPSFTVTAQGSGSLAYQWSKKNGVVYEDLVGQTSSTLSFSNVALNSAGTYRVKVSSSQTNFVYSNDAVLTVHPRLVISTPPVTPVTAGEGTHPYFTVGATGPGTISYEWSRKVGADYQPLSGETGHTLTFNSVQLNAAGTYRVTVKTPVGNQSVPSSDLVLNVTAASQPLAITNQPASLVQANVNGSASFTVFANGPGNLTFQWYKKNGANYDQIANATGSTLDFPNVQTDAAGTYRVTVTSSAGGSVNSDDAVLVVNSTSSGPTITQHPQLQDVDSGGTATFSVNANGAGLTFQWRRNGSAIPGKTTNPLVITNVQPTDRGYYSVTIKDSAQLTATSSAAQLIVDDIPPTEADVNVVEIDGSNSETVGSSANGYNAALRLIALDNTIGNYSSIENVAQGGAVNGRINFVNISHTGGAGAIDFLSRANGGSLTRVARLDATTGFTLDQGLLTGAISGLTLAAGGTNQNLTLSPSGTGEARLYNGSASSMTLRLMNAATGNQVTDGLELGVDASGVGKIWARDDALTLGVTSEERARLTTSGSFLVGTATDSANGKIQLADHTTSSGGIGFGADTSVYREGAQRLAVGGARPVKLDSQSGRFIAQGSTGGWAGVGFTWQGSGGTPRAELAAKGTNDAVDYVYLGTTVATGEWLTFSPVQTIIKTGTASTDKDSGALVVEGGVGVEGSLYTGGNIRAGGSVTVDGGLGVTGASNLGTAIVSGLLTAHGGAQINGGAQITGGVQITGLTTLQTVLVSGSLQANGGAQIAGPSSYRGDMAFESPSGSAAGSLTWGTTVTDALKLKAGSGRALYLGGGNSETDGLTIGTTGNIGIATAAPTDKVAIVAGTGDASLNGALSLKKNGGQTFRFYFREGTDDLFFGRPGLRLGGFGNDGSVALGGLDDDNLTAGPRFYVHGPTRRVGIGTGTPSAKLDVVGDGRFSGGLIVAGDSRVTSTTISSTPTTGAMIVDGGLGVAGNANIGATLKVGSGGSATSITGGNVTASGTVNAGSVSTNGNIAAGSVTTTGAVTATNYISTTGAVAGGSSGLTFNAGGFNQNITLNPSGGGSILANGPLLANGNVLVPNGRIAVGNSNPQSKVDINGGGVLLSPVGISGWKGWAGVFTPSSPGLYVQNQSGHARVELVAAGAGSNVVLSGTATGGSLVSQAASPAGSRLQLRLISYDGSSYAPAASLDLVNDETHTVSSRPTAITFSTTQPNDTSPAERMRVTPQGSLLIGATTNHLIDPQNPGLGRYKLEVNGAVHAKEIVVDITNWADYVFDEKYRNAPLSEVEAHIKQYKHLPGVPSAKQVTESGVNVAQMQATLLAKVEELTLHLIEQDKRIKKLEAENQALRVNQ